MRRPINDPPPVAAPTEMETKYGPLFLAKARVTGNQAWKVFMRGTSITVFKSVLANWKDQALFLEFPVPSTGESQRFVAVVRQRQTTRRQPFKLVRRFTNIFDRSVYPEKAEVSAAENQDLQLQLSNWILPNENQEIPFALRTLQLKLRCPSDTTSMALQSGVPKKCSPVLRDNRYGSIFNQFRSREWLSSKTCGAAR